MTITVLRLIDLELIVTFDYKHTNEVGDDLDPLTLLSSTYDVRDSFKDVIKQFNSAHVFAQILENYEKLVGK